MNINDFKNAYEGIHATPELKKRLMDKAAADSEAKKSPKKIRFLGAACGAAAAAVFILGGAFLIRWLNMKAQPSIVVTAGSMPVLTDTPVIASTTAAAAQPDVVFQLASDRSYPVDEMPEIDDKYYAEYSFRNVYDERFADAPDGAENWYEWVVTNKLSVDEAREALAGKGFDESETDAIATRNKELCEKIFADYGYKCSLNGSTAYMTVWDLYSYDIMDFYTLYAGGITSEDMYGASQRMLDIAGAEDVCNIAMKRKALLYESYAKKMDAFQNGINIESDWALQYFDERVTQFGSKYEYAGVTIDNLFAGLFTEEQLRTISETVGSADVYVIPNYWAAIVRMEISAGEARNALEKMSEMYREKTSEELFTEQEIGLITGESEYLYTEHFLAPCAELSCDNLLGGKLIVCGASIVTSGAYDWLLDYRDIDIESAAQEICYNLEADGYDELLGDFRRQLDIYKDICDITEQLGAYIKANDISLLEDSKPELDGETRQLLRKMDLQQLNGYTINGEDFYEMKLNYLAYVLAYAFQPEQAETIFDEVCEKLTDAAQKNWLIKKKYLYLNYCGAYGSDDGSVMYNDEYLSALLYATNYEYRISGGTVYLEPYFSGIIEYLNSWHIRNTAPMEKLSESVMQTLYEDKDSLSDYTITVEAPVGAITQEGYYNTTENIYLCVYGSDGGLISRAGSQNGMSGLDGFLIYAAPDEKYFDVYTSPNGEIIIILRTFYPERYRKEGEAFLFDEAAGELKRFGTSQDMPEGYNYSGGIFDYGDGGLEPYSDSEAAYINTEDGVVIAFDFDSMLIKSFQGLHLRSLVRGFSDSDIGYRVDGGYTAELYSYAVEGQDGYYSAERALQLCITDAGREDVFAAERVTIEGEGSAASQYFIETMRLSDGTQLIAVYGIFPEEESMLAELFRFDSSNLTLDKFTGEGYYGYSEIAYAPGCLTLKDGTDNVFLNSADQSEITLNSEDHTFIISREDSGTNAYLSSDAQ